MSTDQVMDALTPHIGEVRRALEAFGRAEIITWLDAQARELAEARPVIVVAGETKRGKSEFVNALLGRRVAPSGLDRITNAFVRFYHADQEHATVHLADGSRRDIPIVELPDWATEAGNPDNERGVTRLDVGLTQSHLEGVVLADTPGVGGLHAVHGQVTLEALKRADALVFVLDASSPITAPEVDFLQRAVLHIGEVAIALTKIDRHTDWRQILEADLRLLSQHVPTLAGKPVWPVSSTNCLRWTDRTDGRLRSGFVQADSWLSGRIARTGVLLRRVNLAQSCLSGLAELDRDLAAQVVVRDESARNAVSAWQTRISIARSEAAQWRRELDAAAQAALREYEDGLHAGMAEIRGRFTDAIRHGDAKQAEDFQSAVLSQIAELASRLDSRVTEVFSQATTRIAERLDAETAFEGALLGPAEHDTTRWAVPLPSAPRARLTDHIATAQTFSSGRYLVSGMYGSVAGIFAGGTGAAGIASIDPTGGLLTLPVAALFALLMRKGRRTAVLESELRSWVAEQVSEASYRLSTDYRRALPEVTLRVVDVLERQLAERDAALRRHLAEATQAASLDEAVQQRRLETVTQSRTWIAAQSGAIERIRVAILEDATSSAGRPDAAQRPASGAT